MATNKDISGGCAPDNHDFNQIAMESMTSTGVRLNNSKPRFICRKCGKVIEA